MKQSDINLLTKHGWTIESELPFTIRHEDGSFASGQGAHIVLNFLHIEENEAMDSISQDVIRLKWNRWAEV